MVGKSLTIALPTKLGNTRLSQAKNRSGKPICWLACCPLMNLTKAAATISGESIPTFSSWFIDMTALLFIVVLVARGAK